MAPHATHAFLEHERTKSGDENDRLKPVIQCKDVLAKVTVKCMQLPYQMKIGSAVARSKDAGPGLVEANNSSLQLLFGHVGILFVRKLNGTADIAETAP